MRVGTYYKLITDCHEWAVLWVPADPQQSAVTVCAVEGPPERAQFVVDCLQDADEHGLKGRALAEQIIADYEPVAEEAE